MFKWLTKPVCPVERQDKEWLEGRMNWLANEFGLAFVRGIPVILPTLEFFPDPWEETEAAIRAMLDRMCSFMGIVPNNVVLHLYRDKSFTPTAGLYEKDGEMIHLWLEDNVCDPMAIVAVMAHELAHARLLGDGRVSPDDRDMEPLTDLSTVFFGLGIFGANACLHYQSTTVGNWNYTQSGTMGYLHQRLWGYALGVFAVMRGECRPEWMQYLRLDIRCMVKETIRYISNTGDCTCLPK